MIKIGHRGACGYEPENTLRSFRRALELGVDMIEFDVHKCKSGELVVIHDDRVDRTTNGKGYVSGMDLRDLKNLDAGKGEKIPLLSEVIGLVDGRTRLNIELKGPGTAADTCRVISDCVKTKKWTWKDFLVSSFNHYELRIVRREEPRIFIGALITGIPIGYSKFAERVGAYAVIPSIEFINRKFIDDSHKRGMKVFVYTVNDPEDIRRMKDMGVDGMFSNFPDRLSD